MKKITKPQFAALLLLTDGFSLFCMRGAVTLNTAAGFLAAALLQYALSVPLVKMHRRGRSLSDTPAPVRVLYILLLTISGGAVFSMLRQASAAVYIPYENNGIAGELLIAALTAAVGIYAAYEGIHALSRSAVFIGFIGACYIAVLFITAAARHGSRPLIVNADSLPLETELLRGFASGFGTSVLAVILGDTEGDAGGAVCAYFTGKLALIASAAGITLLSAGGIMSMTEFPAITAVQLTQPFSSQRTDAVFLAAFSAAAVFAAGIHGVCISALLKQLRPEMKYRSAAAFAMMTAAGMLIRETGKYFSIITFLALTAAAIPYRRAVPDKSPEQT